MLGKIDCHAQTTSATLPGMRQAHFLIADLNKSLDVYQTSVNIPDQSRLFSQSQGKLFVVADGMGPENTAERAGQLAIDTISVSVLNETRWPLRQQHEAVDDLGEHEAELLAGLQHAVVACQDAMQREAELIAANREMKAALTLSLLVWPRFYVVQSGDSRCYLQRDGSLRQVTKNVPRPDADVPIEARDPAHPAASRSDTPRADVHWTNLRTGDRILLCTCGLHEPVGEAMIGEALQRNESAAATAHRLTETASSLGSPHGVTALVVRLNPGDPPDASIDDQRKAADAIPALPSIAEVKTTSGPHSAPPDDKSGSPVSPAQHSAVTIR